MLNDDEWAWLEQHLRGDFDHLLIGTSDPLVLAPALHHAERWGEAVARGAWGERAAAKGEELRRAADFDHWAAFGESFERLTGLLAKAGAGALRRAAGVDHGPLRRRPPRLSGRARLPALGGGAQPRLAGGLLAVSQRARRPRAQDDRRSATRASRHRSSAGLARLAGVDRRAGPLAPGRGAVLRQPGRHPDPRRPRTRPWSSSARSATPRATSASSTRRSSAALA